MQITCERGDIVRKPCAACEPGVLLVVCAEDKVHVFNVNVPLGFRDPQGRAITPSIAWTSIDTSSLYQSLYCKEEGGEDTYIWKPDAHRLQPPPPDTDFHTIMQGNISITALQANYVQLRFLS